jgi:hypothetical protein
MTEEMNAEVVEREDEIRNATQPGLMSRILRVTFRILIAIVIGLALGAGIYYGFLRLYRDAIEPIQTYEARIGDLENSLEFLKEDVGIDNAELTDRQAVIEGRLAEQGEAIASVEALVAAAQEDLREQRIVLGTVEDLQGDLEELSLSLGAVSLQVEQLEADIASGDLPAQKVQRTAIYLQAMTLLTRARLELDRDNTGFAGQQIVAAQAALNRLLPAESEVEVTYGDEQLVIAILERLDLILADLRDRPAVAEDELEAVWKLFLEALQPVQLEEIEAGGE